MFCIVRLQSFAAVVKFLCSNSGKTHNINGFEIPVAPSMFCHRQIYILCFVEIVSPFPLMLSCSQACFEECTEANANGSASKEGGVNTLRG